MRLAQVGVVEAEDPQVGGADLQGGAGGGAAARLGGGPASCTMEKNALIDLSITRLYCSFWRLFPQGRAAARLGGGPASCTMEKNALIDLSLIDFPKKFNSWS